MNGNDLKNEVFTKVIQMLDSDGAFTEMVYSILKEMEKYIQTSNAVILQISADKNKIESIAEYQDGSSTVSVQSESFEEFSLCSDRLLYLTYDKCAAKEKMIMDRLAIKTSVTSPIYINGVPAMYLGLFDTKSCLNIDREKQQFIKDMAIIIQSIAQKKVTKNSLLSSYEVLRDILSSIGSAIMVCNKHDGSVFFENDMARQAEEVRRTIRECIPVYLKQADSDKKEKNTMEHYDAESGVWFEIKFSDLVWIDGSSVIVCTAVDITQKKKNQQRIEYQAHNDFLTGLYNRMKCENDLRKLIKEASRKNEKGAVLFIDLDDFKHINDGLGHQYGDILLQQIAAGLQSIPHLRGHCYRMGGDEFVIVIIPEMYAQLNDIIKTIVAMFNKPWYLMETKYYCTMSMGIATFPDDSDDIHEIIKLADIAMYDSKKSGKNRYGFYDNTKKQNTIQLLDIENSMRQAVSSEINEFVVFYQPVVETETKECDSCEALVRWDSKALGFMHPGDFIPLAEYLGLITSIGDYVLEEACKQCRLWNDNGYPDFRIHVNLSVVQLMQKNVVENINNILSRTQVNPDNIILEITESFAINDMERVLDIIEGLKKLGPKIALDDFGTGYSSLNYIKQLPLDIIKVDKTFIDDIVEDEYAQAFIKLIVDLSKTIHAQIVVEGVERMEQYELLKSLGVNYIQGYLFGKPVPTREFEQLHLPHPQLEDNTNG